MSATVIELDVDGRQQKAIHVEYSAQNPDAKSIIQYQVYDGRRPLPRIIRIAPKFSGAPYTPSGVDVFVMRTRRHGAFGQEVIGTIEESYITQKMSLADAFSLEKNYRVRRVGNHGGKRLSLDQVIIQPLAS